MSRPLRWSAAALVAVATLLVPPGPTAARQRFSATVDAVTVDVLVTRDGRPVTGLTAADFSLRDNGVPQQITAVAMEDVPILLLLVLDASGSVAGDPLAQLRAASDAAADALRPDDRVALLTFSHRVRMRTAPTGDPAQIRSASRTVEAAGATALYDATAAALAVRGRAFERTLILLFSDGDDTVSWLDPRDVLAAAQRSDVVVYPVSLERATRVESLADRRRQTRERGWFREEPQLFGRHYLSLLADDTGGSVFVAESDRLRDAFLRVVSEFKSRYVVMYSPRGVAPDGWHAIEVSLKGRRADVQARRGYMR